MTDRTGLFTAPLPGTTPAGTSPTDGRLVLGALYGTAGGCLAGGQFTSSPTQMQIGLSASAWRIPDPTNSAAVFLSPADVWLFTLSAGPASGSRIDLLWVKQNNYEAGDSNSRVVYGVAVGTAASSPTAPALPAGAMKIGQVTVPAGVSNAAACPLVPSYPASVASPAMRATSKALLDLTYGQFTGQIAYVADFEFRWNGSAWRPWSGGGDIAYAGQNTDLDSARHTRVTREGRLGLLRLAVKTGADGPAINGGICFLPDGWRPEEEAYGTVAVYGGDGSGNYTGYAHIRVATNGTVYWDYIVGGTAAYSQYRGTVAFTCAP